MATLTSGGPALVGKTIQFQIQVRAVGKAKTNDQGIAVLSIAKLKRVKQGANGQWDHGREQGLRRHDGHDAGYQRCDAGWSSPW
jgi:hypothetical protein